MQFFKILKEKTLVKQDATSKRHYGYQKGIISKISVFVLALYILVIPVIECPSWCYERQKPLRTDLFVECKDLGVPYSGLPTMGPVFTATLDVSCILFFAFSRWYRTLWRVPSKSERTKNLCMAAIFLLVLGDSTYSIIVINEPYISAFLRPFIFASIMSSVRQNAVNLMHDFKDSSTFIVAIFLWVSFYAIVGRYLYDGTE